MRLKSGSVSVITATEAPQQKRLFFPRSKVQIWIIWEFNVFYVSELYIEAHLHVRCECQGGTLWAAADVNLRNLWRLLCNLPTNIGVDPGRECWYSVTSQCHWRTRRRVRDLTVNAEGLANKSRALSQFLSPAGQQITTVKYKCDGSQVSDQGDSDEGSQNLLFMRKRRNWYIFLNLFSLVDRCDSRCLWRVFMLTQAWPMDMTLKNVLVRALHTFQSDNDLIELKTRRWSLSEQRKSV